MEDVDVDKSMEVEERVGCSAEAQEDDSEACSRESQTVSLQPSPIQEQTFEQCREGKRDVRSNLPRLLSTRVIPQTLDVLEDLDLPHKNEPLESTSHSPQQRAEGRRRTTRAPLKNHETIQSIERGRSAWSSLREAAQAAA